DRGAALAHLHQVALPGLGGLAVGAEERVVVHGRPVPLRAVDFPLAHLHQRATDRDGFAEHLARDRAGRDTERGLARRGPAAAAIVTDTVFQPVGEVGMARAEAVL